MNLAASTPPVLAWMSSLADATRLRCLRLVERHELTVAELCAVLQAPQSTVSRHLKVLSDEGWVSARPEGTSRLYRMATEALEPTARRLWALLREQAAPLPVTDQDDRRLASVLAARQTQSQAFFSTQAGQWDRVRREMFGDRFDLLALAALLDPDWTVADLGCGTGTIAAAIAPFVARVIAVETSRAMLGAARRRLGDVPNVDLRSGDLEALPIDDGALDAAIGCLVLHHVADPAAVLREAARALRPGARILIVDMARHDRVEYQRQMGHVWLGFEPSRIEDWLLACGFENPRVRPLPPAPEAKGPALFAASAARAARTRANGGSAGATHSGQPNAKRPRR
ncbi:MAG TPA: metalloregulator ArsR/SmtB family transcription factor [Candidatus Binatia bacterium]|nr:metalloregulator ArsR/SmtB family transcription factor [Candidatus Binatia bacterium]